MTTLRFKARPAMIGVAAVLLAVLVAAGCGSSNSGSSSSTGSGGTAGSSTTLVGAGSTLVAPLMSQWQPVYDTATGVAVTYGAIGSGGGIAQITARTVDFGASDAPLTPSQFSDAKGVVQIPWALAATVVAYNVKGVPNQLKLTGPLLADIWMGKVTSGTIRRSPSSIRASVCRPPRSRPCTAPTAAATPTPSPTTFRRSVPQWKSQVGNSTQVSFPTGLGRQGQLGRRRRALEHRRLHRLHRHLLRAAEQASTTP